MTVSGSVSRDTDERCYFRNQGVQYESILSACHTDGSHPFLSSCGRPVVLTVDVENVVIYRGTVFDASKLAKDPGPTTSANQAFVEAINIGDIVAVNGKPVKGLWSSTVYATPYRAATQPGQPIADFDLAGTNFCTWQFYATDGTFLGMIRDSGAGSGHRSVGALAGFFGAVGTHQGGSLLHRRGRRRLLKTLRTGGVYGGGKMSVVFYLYPRLPADDSGHRKRAFSLPIWIIHRYYAEPARPGETVHSCRHWSRPGQTVFSSRASSVNSRDLLSRKSTLLSLSRLMAKSCL
jgi:hypothetical protein